MRERTHTHPILILAVSAVFLLVGIGCKKPQPKIERGTIASGDTGSAITDLRKLASAETAAKAESAVQEENLSGEQSEDLLMAAATNDTIAAMDQALNDSEFTNPPDSENLPPPSGSLTFGFNLELGRHTNCAQVIDRWASGDNAVAGSMCLVSFLASFKYNYWLRTAKRDGRVLEAVLDLVPKPLQTAREILQTTRSTAASMRSGGARTLRMIRSMNLTDAKELTFGLISKIIKRNYGNEPTKIPFNEITNRLNQVQEESRKIWKSMPVGGGDLSSFKSLSLTEAIAKGDANFFNTTFAQRTASVEKHKKSLAVLESSIEATELKLKKANEALGKLEAKNLKGSKEYDALTKQATELQEKISNEKALHSRTQKLLVEDNGYLNRMTDKLDDIRNIDGIDSTVTQKLTERKSLAALKANADVVQEQLSSLLVDERLLDNQVKQLAPLAEFKSADELVKNLPDPEALELLEEGGIKKVKLKNGVAIPETNYREIKRISTSYTENLDNIGKQRLDVMKQIEDLGQMENLTKETKSFLKSGMPTLVGAESSDELLSLIKSSPDPSQFKWVKSTSESLTNFSRSPILNNGKRVINLLNNPLVGNTLVVGGIGIQAWETMDAMKDGRWGKAAYKAAFMAIPMACSAVGTPALGVACDLGLSVVEMGVDKYLDDTFHQQLMNSAASDLSLLTHCMRNSGEPACGSVLETANDTINRALEVAQKVNNNSFSVEAIQKILDAQDNPEEAEKAAQALQQSVDKEEDKKIFGWFGDKTEYFTEVRYACRTEDGVQAGEDYYFRKSDIQKGGGIIMGKKSRDDATSTPISTSNLCTSNPRLVVKDETTGEVKEAATVSQSDFLGNSTITSDQANQVRQAKEDPRGTCTTPVDNSKDYTIQGLPFADCTKEAAKLGDGYKCERNWNSACKCWYNKPAVFYNQTRTACRLVLLGTSWCEGGGSNCVVP